MDERRILLINDKDEIVVGYVKFFPDWFETWKKGGEGAIFEIAFDEGKTPDMLEPRQIQELYDEGIERFKDKMGITPEDYQAIGGPSYKEVGPDVKQGIKDYCVRKYLRKELWRKDNPIEVGIKEVVEKYGWDKEVREQIEVTEEYNVKKNERSDGECLSFA